MNRVVGEARKRATPAGDEQLNLVSLGQPAQFVEDVVRLIAIKHFYSLPLYAVPTMTLRNRAGAAPWPVPITCCGCPLPQFGVPHNVHSSREQMVSIEFQNSVVMPE